MTIKAVLRNGHIEPLEPLPSEWIEGQELLVEQPAPELQAQVEQWARDVESASQLVPAEEHRRFQEALEAIRREGKEAMRREWGES